MSDKWAEINQNCCMDNAGLEAVVLHFSSNHFLLENTYVIANYVYFGVAWTTAYDSIW